MRCSLHSFEHFFPVMLPKSPNQLRGKYCSLCCLKFFFTLNEGIRAVGMLGGRRKTHITKQKVGRPSANASALVIIQVVICILKLIHPNLFVCHVDGLMSSGVRTHVELWTFTFLLKWLMWIQCFWPIKCCFCFF